MEKMTVGQRNILKIALEMGQIDPAKTTLVEAVDKFQELGFRHLTLYIENGGYFCLCGDPELCRRFRDAVERIEEEMDREEDAKTSGNAA